MDFVGALTGVLLERGIGAAGCFRIGGEELLCVGGGGLDGVAGGGRAAGGSTCILEFEGDRTGVFTSTSGFGAAKRVEKGDARISPEFERGGAA